jgi:hypothetical protein
MAVRVSPASLSSHGFSAGAAADTAVQRSSSPDLGVLVRELSPRRAPRRLLVLRYLATHPGASSRELGEGVGVFDVGQFSRLLACVARLGLACSDWPGSGHRRAWYLTPAGEEMTLLMSVVAPGLHAGGAGEPPPRSLWHGGSSRSAHRRGAVLRYLAAHPGASDAEIAAAVGIRDNTQLWRLVNRARELGLLCSEATPEGHRNAWRLTRLGRRMAESLESPCSTAQTQEIPPPSASHPSPARHMRKK